jgi:DNA polymerase
LGGWVNAWKNFGADKYFENDEAIKRDVLKWRAESPEIVEMWGGQYRQVGPRLSDAVWELYGLEGMAIAACLNPGRVFDCRAISFWVENDILYCRLPSGRCLHYHRPRLEPDQDFLRRSCWRITFECYNTNATKGPIGWSRFHTYGPRIFENIVQGVARDVQALAMVRAEQADYPVVMHTHDELTTEVPDTPDYSVAGLIEVMTQRPEWARDWPIKAAGWEDYLYQKD